MPPSSAKHMDQPAFLCTLEKLGKNISAQGSLTKHGYSPEDFDCLYSLAYSLYQSGDYKRARTVFHHLTVCKPMEAKHWFGLASVFQMERGYENALTGWSMAAMLESSNPLPHYHAAECLFSLDEKKEGLKALQEVKKRLAQGDQEELREKVALLEASQRLKGQSP